MILLLTFIVAAYATLAIWAAVSPRRWFVRAAILCGTLALLLPVRAYEPLVLLGITSIWLVAGTQLIRRKFRSELSPANNQPQPQPANEFRFSLRDLLLAAGVVGFASLVIGMLVREGISISWWRATTAAALLALIASLAVGLVVSRRRTWCLAGLLVAIPVAAACDALVLGDWMHVDEILSNYREWSVRGAGLRGLIWVYASFAAWSMLLAIVMPAWQPADRATILGRMLRVASLALAIPLAVLWVCLYWHMLGRSPSQADEATGENVYRQIVALAQRLETASPDQASAIYAEILPLVERPGHVVFDWNAAVSGNSQSRPMQDRSALYSLTHALCGESELLRARGKAQEAVKYAAACLHLSRIVSTGDVFVAVDPPSQVAFNGGLVALAQVRRDVTPQQAAELARLLETLEADREPTEAMLERDVRWRARSRGWRFELERSLMGELVGFDIAPTPASRAYELTMRDLRCMGSMLATDLALRAYRANHGQWPSRLDDLCPDYLDAIPNDPLTGRPYVYRPAEPEFVLYSVGKDRIDNQGRFGNATRLYGSRHLYDGYDIDVDIYTRP